MGQIASPYTTNVVGLPQSCFVCQKLREVADAYTYLNLTSANRYGIQASLYDSKDFLKAKSGQSKDIKGGKVDGYFYRQKKDEDDWRSMDLH